MKWDGANVGIFDEQMHGLDLFSGIGGITLALKPWVRPVAYCEIDPFARSILLSRMLDGELPYAPIWDDVCTLGVRDLPRIDIIYGGFPCQDLSIAGRKRGIEGERSGLFFEISRLVDECSPRLVFLENVPNIRKNGLDRVLQKLTDLGYDCAWHVLSAREIGAPHERKRWFCLARKMVNPNGKGEPRLPRRTETELHDAGNANQHQGTDYWSADESRIRRMVDGLPEGVDDRLSALGNSVVPQQVREAFIRLWNAQSFRK